MASTTVARATKAVPVARAGKRPGRLRQALVGWGFAAPFTVLFAVFMALPVLASLVMSLTDLRSTDLRHPFAVTFVGLDNYVKLFQDDLFVKAAGNTAIFVVVGVPLTVAAGLAAATALNSGLIRFKALFRVGFYLPVVTSIVAIAVVWRFLLDPDAGLVDSLLERVGIPGPHWLTDSHLALPSLIIMTVWRNFGFLMVVFLAALQAIPSELYESARLDGASRWQQFRNVTLPMMRPTLLFGGVVTSIGYLQVFEEPFVMTRGGPLNSTLSVAYDIYNQFGFGNYGYAAAASYVLFAVIVALSLMQFRLLGQRD